MKRDYGKITVIVPIYNTEILFLEKCIESILKQTYNNIEVILSCDGATKECIECCQKYGENDKRIKIVIKENSGVSTARNIGIELATGEWIMFVDSDDWISEDCCEVLYQGIQSENTEVVIGQLALYKENEIVKINYRNKTNDIISTQNTKKELIESLFKDFDCRYMYIEGINSKIYKRKFLIENNIRFNTDLKVGEDVSFNYIAYMCAEQIVYLNKPVYIYRIHAESVSIKFDEKLIYKYSDFLGYLKNLFDKYDNNNQIYDLFVIRQVEKIIRKTKKKKQLKNILEMQPYRESIKNVPLTILNPKRKLLVIFLRHKKFALVKALMKI